MSDWSNDRSGAIMWAIVLTVVTGGLGIAYGIASWEECRRFHPAWYCAGQQ